MGTYQMHPVRDACMANIKTVLLLQVELHLPEKVSSAWQAKMS